MASPLKAIREKCMQCTCGQRIEIRNCTVKTCALYGFRMGHKPKDEEEPEEGDEE